MNLKTHNSQNWVSFTEVQRHSLKKATWKLKESKANFWIIWVGKWGGGKHTACVQVYVTVCVSLMLLLVVSWLMKPSSRSAESQHFFFLERIAVFCFLSLGYSGGKPFSAVGRILCSSSSLKTIQNFGTGTMTFLKINKQINKWNK